MRIPCVFLALCMCPAGILGLKNVYSDYQEGTEMLEHPYIAKLKIVRRYERMRREADVWRLFHPKGKRRAGGLLRQVPRLLCSSGRALVRLGERVTDHSARAALGTKE